MFEWKLLDVDPNDQEEDGANIDLDSQRKGKCAVIKTSTRQVGQRDFMNSCSLVFLWLTIMLFSSLQTFSSTFVLVLGFNIFVLMVLKCMTYLVVSHWNFRNQKYSSEIENCVTL